jgi:hypothetical protein
MKMCILLTPDYVTIKRSARRSGPDADTQRRYAFFVDISRPDAEDRHAKGAGEK